MGDHRKGVEVRPNSIRLTFTWQGQARKETLMTNGAPMAPTAANLRWAERLAAEVREKIRLGTFSMAEYFPASGGNSGQDLTLGRHLDTWLQAQTIESSTRKTYTSIVRFWKSAIVDSMPLGERPLKAIRHSDLLRALATKTGPAGADDDGQPASISAKTINNYVSVLREALDLAVTDKVLAENPALLLKRAKHQKEPPDPFSADEVEAILANLRDKCDAQEVNYAEFRFFTGLRPGEAIALQWRNIDFIKAEMRVRESVVLGRRKATKTNKVRTVRLNSRALAALKRQKEHTFLAGTHVFHDPRKGTGWADEKAFKKRCWVPTLKRLGMRWRPPYNMRHSYATMMLMADMKPAFCARQMGHSVEVFHSTYATWLDGERDDLEMRRLETALAQQAGFSPDFPQKTEGG